MRFARLLVIGLPLCAGFSVRPLVSKRSPYHPAPLSMSEQQQDAPKTYPPPNAVPDGMKTYEAMHKQSLEEPDTFWGDAARSTLKWFREFDRVSQGGFDTGDVAWFTGGQLNACYNCIDQHLPQRAKQVAILHEGDEPGVVTKITYEELLRQVCRMANAMKELGVKKGDFVTLYMPMVPEAAVAMLACARLGAPHSVVFAGFSAEALRDRIVDANSKWVFTTDEGRRGGKTLHLKSIVDKAVEDADCVEKVLVITATGAKVPMGERDVQMSEMLPRMRPYCPCETMDSEDLLFILYTSGSTGRPKGVAHTTAGYLLYTGMTTKHAFGLEEGDVFACVADVGWITGHSYIVYGPLVNGATTLMFESTPMYPNHGRYWDVVQRHKVTQFYTAPTAIRALMSCGPEIISDYDLSSLRVLGSVGEPINPEAWRWYNEHVGKGKCHIVDTFWQTETGGHVMLPLANVTPTKPGSCSFPFFGIEPAVLNAQTGEEVTGNDVEGVLAFKRPWPSLARTVYGDHKRYMDVYLNPYKGYYFTGDGCHRDSDGFYWITGRVDDVLNVSGHRIGTAEVESALVLHPAVSEAAVVGFPDPIKGQAICCYVTFVSGYTESPELLKELVKQVATHIGPFARPGMIVGTPGLPKTRSGKIMRRILRKIAEGEADKLGDTSTLADPSIVEGLVEKANALLGKMKR
ncbi:unnamed protein product [Ectocarpus fasciculatus]